MRRYISLMSWIRAIGIAAGLVSGGVALARNRLDHEIDRKVEARIETARAEALKALEDEVDVVIRKAVYSFSRNLLIKAIAVGGIVSGRIGGLYDRPMMAILILVCVGCFLCWDVLRAIPAIRLGWPHLRKANWNPLKALRAHVGATIFDKAYERVIEETQEKRVKYWIAASRHNPDDISTRIAEAVSEVAAAASVRIVRARLIVAALWVALLSSIYSGLLAYTTLL